MIAIAQCFSKLALLTFCVKQFFIVLDCPLHCLQLNIYNILSHRDNQNVPSHFQMSPEVGSDSSFATQIATEAGTSL